MQWSEHRGSAKSAFASGFSNAEETTLCTPDAGHWMERSASESQLQVERLLRSLEGGKRRGDSTSIAYSMVASESAVGKGRVSGNRNMVL